MTFKRNVSYVSLWWFFLYWRATESPYLFFGLNCIYYNVLVQTDIFTSLTKNNSQHLKHVIIGKI